MVGTGENIMGMGMDGGDITSTTLMLAHLSLQQDDCYQKIISKALSCHLNTEIHAVMKYHSAESWWLYGYLTIKKGPEKCTYHFSSKQIGQFTSSLEGAMSPHFIISH